LEFKPNAELVIRQGPTFEIHFLSTPPLVDILVKKTSLAACVLPDCKFSIRAAGDSSSNFPQVLEILLQGTDENHMEDQPGGRE
jgi:hypothetical protein